MYAAEQKVFAAGTESFSVMRIAGEGVADALHSRFPEGRIRILCGPGGNGGDGFVAAARLKALGRDVDVFLLGDAGALKGDSARAASLWQGPVHPLAEAIDRPAAVTLDALFGGGLSRPLEGAAAELSRQAGEVVSVDVPSGLDGLTTRPIGPCFRADLTVTFAGYRPAHLLSPGRALCGEVMIHEIGVPLPLTVRTNEPAIWTDADVESEPARQMVCLTDAAFDERHAEEAQAAPNRIDAVQAVARKLDQLVVLAGSDIILADPDGRCVVDIEAMACPDIDLPSRLAAVTAQGELTFPAACAAVWQAHADRY